MRSLTWKMTAAAGLATVALGCRSVEPKELIDARTQYETARQGPAATLAPAELYTAQKVLDAANNTYEADGDTQRVRDIAYVAQRRIEVAQTKARSEAERKLIADSQRAASQLRDAQVRNVQSELAKTKEQLLEERRRMETANKELQRTAEQLEQEKQARAAAEAKVAAAMKDLAEVAAVKEEARGTVITLSGSVLFISGRWNLLETAKIRLNQIAEALSAQGEEKHITVEGHTDSQGDARANEVLSRRRAEAVRQYLVVRGVSEDKISAVGVGEARPVASNSTSEGRANNRRVEIVIGNSAGASR